MKWKTGYPFGFAVAAAAMIFMGASLRASDTDARIESSFKETYVYKMYLKNDAVKADVRDGVVTLTGTVTEESHRVLAEEAVTDLPGVVRVDNQLVIKYEPGSENADAWIRLKVKTTLLFHRNVSASETAVEVKDGIVILRGDASSAAQRELTTEYAEDVDGVKDVKNYMTVLGAPVEPADKSIGEKIEDIGRKVGEKAKDIGRKVGDKVEDVGESIDDASITAQVRTALWIHRSTKSVHTKVKTHDGQVTVTGIAKNEAEKSLVAKLISDVRGVKGINNQMTVEVVQTK